jgi:uncharacterized protein involved in exopolysaccharide biosynthesis
MEIHPEQIVRTLIKEAFVARRLFVVVFVLVNAALLTAGLMWPKFYAASTSILVEDRNIIQTLMQGAARPMSPTDQERA